MFQDGGKLYFHFLDQRDPNHPIRFDQELPSAQCRATNKQHLRCKRQVIIGTPYCFQHLASNMHLKIKDSTIPNAGKGLFCYAPGYDGVVFAKGKWILPYSGDELNREQLIERYGETSTKPYVLQVGPDRYLDAATYRSAAGLINHDHEEYANCKFALHPQVKSIWVQATKNIKDGDELTIDYGASYKHNVKNVHHSTDNRKYARFPEYEAPQQRRRTTTSSSTKSTTSSSKKR